MYTIYSHIFAFTRESQEQPRAAKGSKGSKIYESILHVMVFVDFWLEIYESIVYTMVFIDFGLEIYESIVRTIDF